MYDILPPAPDLTPPSGYLLAPAKASSATGQLLFECVVGGIVNALVQKIKQE